MRPRVSYTYQSCVAVLCFFLGFRAEASPTMARAAPVDPEAAWAASYLVSTVMVREYEAVLASLDQANKKPAAIEAFLASEPGQALWVRGQFGVHALAARQQSVARLPEIESRLANHAKVLIAHKARVPSALALKKAAEDQAAGGTAEIDAAFVAISQAFAPVHLEERWIVMQKQFTVPPFACDVSPQDLVSLGTFLHKIHLESQSDQSTNPSLILAQVTTWPTAKTRCVALRLGTLPEISPSEHLSLLMVLRQGQDAFGKDTAITALTAQRLIEAARYPESLATLLDLADLDPSFRLAYELLQRIFSVRQRGRGAVALQGI